MDNDEVRSALLRKIRDVVQVGTVTLSSGALSDFYIDMRRLTLEPAGAYLAARLIDEALKNTDFDAVGGLSMGADPIVGAYCYHAYLNKREITGFLVRKEAKKHGTQKLIEGPDLKQGSRVVLVDDVVTSGGSTETAYRAVADAGCKAVKAIALVDREEGAAAKLADLGIDFKAIFTRSEIEGENRE